MDWFPLLNSFRVAAVSTVAVFFAGIFAASAVTRLSGTARGVLDALLSLPLVLPPTAVGWLLLRFLGPRHPLGYLAESVFGVRLVSHWPAAALAAAIVSFPLMYRASRLAFSRMDRDLDEAARTLGCSDAWTFWHVRLPVCRKGVLAGAVLAFARAFGEYGATYMVAGYTEGRTATVSTTIFQLWRESGNAAGWVFGGLFFSAAFLLTVSFLDQEGTGDGPRE